MLRLSELPVQGKASKFLNSAYNKTRQKKKPVKWYRKISTPSVPYNAALSFLSAVAKTLKPKKVYKAAMIIMRYLETSLINEDKTRTPLRFFHFQAHFQV